MVDWFVEMVYLYNKIDEDIFFFMFDFFFCSTFFVFGIKLLEFGMFGKN